MMSGVNCVVANSSCAKLRITTLNNHVRNRINHIMIQFLVNHFPTFHKLFMMVGTIAVVAACSTSGSDITHLLPFRFSAKIASTAPHDKPALWADGDITLMAWPG